MRKSRRRTMGRKRRGTKFPTFKFRVDMGHHSTVPLSSATTYTHGTFPVTTSIFPANFQTFARYYLYAKINKITWTFAPSMLTNVAYYNSSTTGGIFDGPIEYQFGQVGVITVDSGSLVSTGGSVEYDITTWADALAKPGFRIHRPNALIRASLKPTGAFECTDSGSHTTGYKQGKLGWQEVSTLFGTNNNLELGRAIIGCNQPNSYSQIGEYSGQSYGIIATVSVSLKKRQGF